MTAFGAYPLRHGPLIHDDGTVTFRLWAPRHARVDLVRDGHDDVPMDPRVGGWHALRVPAAAGDRYGFRLGGDADAPSRPDPASQRQPSDVHDLSAVVDRGDFAWSAAESRWRPPTLASGAIYELHIGTFSQQRTFDAATAHLAELRDLGITHVEVMPIGAFNGPRGWGYDGVCWYAVHEPYGGPTAFARFVDACHRHDLAVILDVVYNHFGPSGSYHSEFGPYVTERYSTPWGPAINFDGEGADAVRAFVIDNALMWLSDFHVDGLRLDAVHALHDASATHILEELSAAVDRLSEQLGRQLVLIAESDRQDPATVLSRDAGGLGMTAQWLDDLHHGLHVTMTGEHDGYYTDYRGLPDVATAYTNGFVIDGRWSEYRQRTVGRPLPDTVSGRALVACTQNHDQIGNRARGRRLTVLADEEDRVRVGIALLCLAPTVPMLFMGQEYGAVTPFLFFSSHPEPALADSVRTGRREEFAAFTSFAADQIPDPQLRTTFCDSTLDRSHNDEPPAAARRRMWTDMLRLRRTTPALGTGDRTLITPLTVTADVMALRRDDPTGTAPVVVVANASDVAARITFDAPGSWQQLWTSNEVSYGGSATTITIDRGGGLARAAIPAWCVAVLVPGGG